MRAWALAATVLAAPALAQPAAPEPVVDEPRAYGHVVGDLLTRTVHAELAAGQALAADALPRPGRVDTWFDLREASATGQGSGVTIKLVYQLINAPQKVSTLALPALRLPLGRGAALEVPEWPVAAGPLTAETVLSRAGLPRLQPDLVPEAPARAPLAWRLALWCTLALAAAAWWALRRHPEWARWRRHAPFADALAELRRLARAPDGDAAAARLACTRLHRAFDQAAGGALFSAGLPGWLAQRPALAPLAGEVQAFFGATRQGFFEAGAALPSAAQVLALCWRLARAEGGG